MFKQCSDYPIMTLVCLLSVCSMPIIAVQNVESVYQVAYVAVTVRASGDGHNIETQAQTQAVPLDKSVGCTAQRAHLLGRDSLLGARNAVIGSCLNLHNDELIAVDSYDIYVAMTYAPVAFHNAIALVLQEKCRNLFTPLSQIVVLSHGVS